MKYQLLPPLSEEEYAELKADIAARGVIVPVEKDEDGNTLDGHHRLQICEELEMDCPVVVRSGLTEQEKRAHVRSLNVIRRHLSREQKRVVIAEQLKETPEKSNRQIAETLQVSHVTVAAVREQAEATGQIVQLDKTTGKDGKSRTTHAARKQSAPARKPDSSLAEFISIEWPTAGTKAILTFALPTGKQWEVWVPIKKLEKGNTHA